MLLSPFRGLMPKTARILRGRNGDSKCFLSDEVTLGCGSSWPPGCAWDPPSGLIRIRWRSVVGGGVRRFAGGFGMSHRLAAGHRNPDTEGDGQTAHSPDIRR